MGMRRFLFSIILGGLAISVSCATTRPAPADFPAEEPGAPCAEDRLISQGCGESFGPFSGTIVGHFQDGTVRPLRDVQFIRRDSPSEAEKPVPVEVSRRGVFSHRVFVTYSVIKRCRDGQIEEQELFGRATFLVRAAGCMEQQVEYQPLGDSVQITLECAGTLSDGLSTHGVQRTGAAPF